MFRSLAAPSGRLDDLLSSLPDGWRRCALGPFRLVVGATGAFVLGEATGPDVGRVADRLAREAEQLRSRLARAVVWAPFVEALVVTDEPVAGPPRATVVPSHLLHDLLLSGPALLDPEVVEQVAELADAT